MKRFICGLTLVFALAGLAVASALGAGRGSQTLTATCTTGTTSTPVTVHASSGQSAWVDNTHYVVLRFTGVFTPAGGTPQMFTKVYGHKRGFRTPTLTCSGSQSATNGDTFSFTAVVARTPAH
jgi:hypothetical protein